MTRNATPDDRQLTLAPLDEKVDHVRGSPAGHLIIPAELLFDSLDRVKGLPRVRALVIAAALQDRFWDMHELLFHRQKALEGADLLRYAARLGLDVAAFDRDRTSSAVADRIRRDVDSGLASDQVLGTPTLFIDGLVHRGGYDPPALLAALAP